MDRPEFAELLDVKIDTLRVWEAGKSKPRGPAAMKIVKIANRNYYPHNILCLGQPLTTSRCFF
jgi:DNA-binding transcriptional regulator YiaG